MKYIFLPAILIAGVAWAQLETAKKPLDCADTQILLRGLMSSSFKETPVWTGVEPGVTLPKYSLFVNEKTGSWTLIQFNDTTACVLGTGESSNQIFYGPRL